MDDISKGQAAKSVLSDLLKKLRAFGLDEPDGEADPANLDADLADSTEGTDLDLVSKNPEMDEFAADPKEGPDLDSLAATDEETDPLKDEMKKFFQKTSADQVGNPKTSRIDVTQIKASPLKKARP